MTQQEWESYFDTLSLDEIKNLYWSEFDQKARKTLNPYLKMRMIKNKK